MYRTIELGKFRKIHQPFAIFFVYPKDEEPVVIKGMVNEVRTYLNKNFPHALYRYTFWENGVSRGSWNLTGKRYIFKRKRGYEVSIYDPHTHKLIRKFHLRRIPKRWIPEFDY